MRFDFLKILRGEGHQQNALLQLADDLRFTAQKSLACGARLHHPNHHHRPRVGVPNALREQAIQIGKRRIVIDEEPEALAICFARPLAVPDLTTRIMRIELLASEC
jgi:hypothetical protein